MRILLSIKPEFAEQIFDGTKRFEFRRSIFARDDVDVVVVYASAPIGKVIGEFKIGRILSDRPTLLWKRTTPYAGISKKRFFEYFSGKSIGYAIEIDNYELYDRPLPLYESFGCTPPQSFAYV